jgi:hypothetical protein
LLGRVFFDGDPIGYARCLGLVSFDCHPWSPFFSHRRRTLLLCVSLLLLTPLAISAQNVTTAPTTKLALSLVQRSLARSLSSKVPASLTHSPPLAARALRIVLSLSSESRRCSWLADRMRGGERGQRMSTAASSKADASVFL